MNPLVDQLIQTTRSLLDLSRPAYTLRNEVLELKTIFEQASETQFDGTEIARGETRTDVGVAISPTMAAMCLDDFARTVQFMRGVYKAIRDQLSVISSRPVRVLYAGCGPWATLAVPIMSLLSGDKAKFTLLDIHADSIDSTQRTINALGFADRVERFETADACQFVIDGGAKPDVIVIEMLRATLDAEPQVAVSMNLRAQAPNAVIIPETVEIDLALVDVGREFSGDAAPDRIELGRLFTLDRSCSDPVRIAIPDFDDTRYRLTLLTTIRIYGDLYLKDRDSGITCPKPLQMEGGVKASDVLEFVYELTDAPRLKARRL